MATEPDIAGNDAAGVDNHPRREDGILANQRSRMYDTWVVRVLSQLRNNPAPERAITDGDDDLMLGTIQVLHLLEWHPVDKLVGPVAGVYEEPGNLVAVYSALPQQQQRFPCMAPSAYKGDGAAIQRC